MSRYIDAEWLKAFFEADKGKSRNTPIDSLLALIDDAPSIDIVRCKECKWFGDEGWCFWRDVAIKDDDFCSYGERK